MKSICCKMKSNIIFCTYKFKNVADNAYNVEILYYNFQYQLK